jgi:hypothetical protein
MTLLVSRKVDGYLFGFDVVEKMTMPFATAS